MPATSSFSPRPPNPPRPQFGDPCGPWRGFFAWRPVSTYDGVRVWLRPVLRRRIQRHHFLSGPGDDFWWQYTLEAP